MAISVSCACGKQFRTKDENAGKRGRCPGCGQPVQIPGAVGFNMPASKRSTAVNPAAGGGSFHVSGNIIGMAVALLLILAFVLVIKFGPLAARDQWAKISEQGKYDILDVATFAIRAEHSHHGYFGTAGHAPPGAKEVLFIESGVMMSVPQTVPFRLTSSEGIFDGQYQTRTGEITMDLEISGSKIKVTGRVKNQKPEVEINGKPATILPGSPGQIE